MKRLIGIVAFCFMAVAAHACTVFVLVNDKSVLFCDNEDWSNTNTRVWFIPGEKTYGCVILGFDNGWPQCGMNTAGLAIGWVAGYEEKWVPDPKLPELEQSESRKLLETCKTIDDAIAHFRNHQVHTITRAKALAADPTGASVMIGAKNGRLQIEISRQSHSLGYGKQECNKMFSESQEVTLGRAHKILTASQQDGEYATKYSCVFDLKSGEIIIDCKTSKAGPIKLMLADELKKGPHYYEIPKLGEQLKQPLRALTDEMKKY